MHDRPSYHDLERRVRDLELATAGTARVRGPRRRAPYRRFLVMIATVLVIAALPMMTVASDRFRDVDDSHPFHDAINELWRARITGGCATNPRRYCPDDAVSRGQMAGFLTRGLGRVAYDTGSSASGGVVASITVDAGDLPGGTGYVLINASVTASTENQDNCPDCPVACPCAIAIGVENAPYDPSEVHFSTGFNVFGPEAPEPRNGPEGGFVTASGSMSKVFLVPSGESTTFDLFVKVERTEQGTVNVTGDMTALYVPFGEASP